MRKLFGTDGIRGVAGQYPLDGATTFVIGRALGNYLSKHESKPRVVIGQDTRESSPRIADAVAAGLNSWGVEVGSAGVITTPGIAYLARTQAFAAGVVISASHNPWQDNGIKIFGGDGYKLPDAVELDIERMIFAQIEAGSGVSDPDRYPQTFPTVPGEHKLREAYEKWLRTVVQTQDIGQLRVVVDCANGAASTIAPELFASLPLRVDFIHCSPNGRNINENCGALHPEIVAREVVARKANLGITFDGDADRALFADARGNVVNGDAVMLLAARDLHAAGELKEATVVATTMSNMGLEAALRRSGIGMRRAPVGDKYVLEEMQKTGAVLGGEQSGHIIFLSTSTTGDGLLTALKVLEIVGKAKHSLDELLSDLKVFPQIVQNVRVREKRPLEEMPAVTAAIRFAESELQESGRVVIRYSGTEALARVMIEAESEARMKHHADSIAEAIRSEIGV